MIITLTRIYRLIFVHHKLWSPEFCFNFLYAANCQGMQVFIWKRWVKCCQPSSRRDGFLLKSFSANVSCTRLRKKLSETVHSTQDKRKAPNTRAWKCRFFVLSKNAYFKRSLRNKFRPKVRFQDKNVKKTKHARSLFFLFVFFCVVVFFYQIKKLSWAGKTSQLHENPELRWSRLNFCSFKRAYFGIT